MALTFANIQLQAILCTQNLWKVWQVLLGKVRLTWCFYCRFYCMPLCFLKNKKTRRGLSCCAHALPVQELGPAWWHSRTSQDPAFVSLLSCLLSCRLIFSLTAGKQQPGILWAWLSTLKVSKSILAWVNSRRKLKSLSKSGRRGH